MRKSEGGQEVKPGNGEYKRWLFTGLVDAKPLVFNPTKEQIKEIRGFEPSQAPQYYNLQSPNNPVGKFSKIELLCEFNPRKASITKEQPEGNSEYPDRAHITLSFNISKDIRRSKTGKSLFINSEVRYDGVWATWAESAETIDSKFEFSTDDLREAHEGERTLINLIYAMFSLESSKEAPILGFGLLDTAWDDICDGDVSELNAMIDPTNPASEQLRDKDGNINCFRMLLGIKTSGKGASFMTPFVSDYDYTFAKAGKSLTKRVKERLTDAFQANYQGDLTFKEFDILKAASNSANTPNVSMSHDDSGNTYDTSMSSNAGLDTSYNDGGATDDMPF